MLMYNVMIIVANEHDDLLFRSIASTLLVGEEGRPAC